MNALAGLMNPAAIGQQVGQAFEAGQAKRADMETRNALSGLVTNPDDANAMASLAKYNPQAAMQMQERRQQQQAQTQQAQQAEQDRALKMFPVMANLLGSATDEQSYQQAMQQAQQFGIPGLESAPANFDPQWVQSNLQIAKVLANDPQKLSAIGQKLVDAGYQPGTPEFQAQMKGLIQAEASKVISFESGGGAARIAPDGSVTPLVVPNPGNQPAGAAAGGGEQPPAEAVAALRNGQGSPEQFDQIFGPGAAARAMGGAGSNASGRFPAK